MHDPAEVKARMRAMWGKGDYSVLSWRLEPAAGGL
jgi:hypothetical protein